MTGPGVAHGRDDGPFDVVVYGATAAGVTAAVAAARAGVRVAVVEPGRHVGGMVSGGLGWTDVGDAGVVGGLSGAFYAAVARHYGVDLWDHVGPEPHVAERIFRDWLAEAGVTVVHGAAIDAVMRDGQRITGIIADDGMVLHGRVFVDASYEGDLLALAGVSYRVGRESRSLHGESWAGRQPIRPDPHQFAVPVSPHVSGNAGPLLPLVHDRPMVPEGAGDGAVQSFCYRLCLTDRPDNRMPISRPDDYDPARYELIRRYLAASDPVPPLDRIINLRSRIPNGKVDANSIGPISTNLLDGSAWRYPEADRPERERIRLHHLSYTQGLLYFLGNDPGIPAPIREEMARWGLCVDEFVDTEHWPHQLYVREGRRLVGEYHLTQHDLDRSRPQYDAVGMGSYAIDIREVQRVAWPVPRPERMDAETYNEGYLSVPVEPYQVPYRALLPRFGECDNLLVPVCLSASHVAFSSIRMEPQYMLLGHAAGHAAALAIRDDVAVHHVAVPELQRALVAQGQVLVQS
ncbi:MAG TPA: FAD-dependent oxidoreductase [Thermomicrobiales bacterium]|nr:FAD-dependent oxidoreductase [Thermomicrobiales bacterium]